MYYLRGLINSSRDTVFLQKVWRAGHQPPRPGHAEQAYNDFNDVAERYPNSRYAADARQRMVDLRNLFARHELDTALYYLRRGAYVAAADRAKYLLETYPQSEYQNDAVATLAEAYTGLGNETLAADAKRVLQQNDPQPPVPDRRLAGLPGQPAQAQPVRGREVGAGQRLSGDRRNENAASGRRFRLHALARLPIVRARNARAASAPQRR